FKPYQAAIRRAAARSCLACAMIASTFTSSHQVRCQLRERFWGWSIVPDRVEGPARGARPCLQAEPNLIEASRPMSGAMTSLEIKPKEQAYAQDQAIDHKRCEARTL